ncbi:unnamed protein product [Rodentolepis nana]|uniref:Protein PFC0760c-like n=1 Tax=Rodentolepis nana TaxID=102285 RepID=A0A0R3T4Z3_RODNA|nr:unnamed protein product [Rodentolepis nana]
MKSLAFSLLYLNLLYFISGFAIHEDFTSLKEVNNDKEIDLDFKNKFKREVVPEETGNFPDIIASDSTDGPTTDPSTMILHKITANWNDSSNVDQKTASHTQAGYEEEYTTSVMTDMETNAILTTISTSNRDELEDTIDGESTDSVSETYLEGERTNSENSDLTRSYTATYSDIMDSAPTDPFISEGKYTKNDEVIDSEFTTISQRTETNSKTDYSTSTIAYDSSKNVSEDSIMEQNQENTELRFKEHTERCEDSITDQVINEISDKGQKRIIEVGKDIISTNGIETEAPIEGTTDSLRESASLTRNIRHHFSIVRSNLIKAAESVDNVMDSLRTALESAFENLLDSFSNLNEKDQRNEIKYEGQLLLEKALERKV